MTVMLGRAQHRNREAAAKGFSLLELLLASGLGMLVIAGLISVYLSIKTNNHLQQTWGDLQESGRFAVYILNERIRLAGFVGCVNSTNPVNQDQAIVGYDSANLPSILQPQVISGTDALVINSCVSNSYISSNSELHAIAYFIGDTKRKNSQGQPILALFQKPLDGDREELVTGVEQMQLLYGVAADASIDHVTYLPAAQITDWQTVRSVQIDLLLNSVEPVLSTPQSYFFQGKTVQPTDRLIHRPWSTYITLRERLHGF